MSDASTVHADTTEEGSAADGSELLEARRTELRNLLSTHVAPLVHEAEETETFPVEVIELLGEGGFLRIGAPVDEGGLGGGRRAEAMVVEELSRVAAGIAMSVMPFFITRVGIWEFCTEEAIEEVGKPMLRGERILGISITEPDAGSDVSGLSTTATPDGDGFRLSGSKIFTTNGTIATDLLVAARIRGTPGIEGIGLFLVETNQSGYEATKLRKESCRSSDTALVHFDDCLVPAHRVGGGGTGGFKRAMHVLNGERILSVARALALAERSWEEAMAWANERHQFGVPIGSFQQVQAPLMRAASELYLIRIAMDEVASMWDSGDANPDDIAMLKAFATERAVDITRTAQHVLGARGLDRTGVVARNARDARLGPVGAGTVQMMHRIIARRFGLPVAVE